jgi:predicted Holliday junction resolvase-like endonuclease
MRESDIVRILKSDRNLYGECSSCGESFQLVKAELFYGDRFTPRAKERVDELMEDFEERTKELRERRRKVRERAVRATTSVNVGKVIEKIVPALPSFRYNPQDCRGLFDPIDFIHFDGLTERGRVDFIRVIDLKTGGAQLNPRQRQIKDAIERNKVEWEVYQKFQR